MRLVILILIAFSIYAVAFDCKKTYQINGYYKLNYNCNYQPFTHFSNMVCDVNLKSPYYSYYWDTLNTVSFVSCKIEHINETVVKNNTFIESISITKGNLTGFIITCFLPSLINLNLSNNLLTSIKHDVFIKTPSLRKLDLSFNMIGYLYESSFSGERK